MNLVLEIVKGAAASAVLTISLTLIIAGDTRWGCLLAAAMVCGAVLGLFRWHSKRLLLHYDPKITKGERE